MNVITQKLVQVLENRKAKSQHGFTLLELLVVVAILAAIAGTATIALQDTDARASAAAHVAMMDELNKGVRTYRVLNHNALPSNMDSLMSDTDSNGAYRMLPQGGDNILAIEDVGAAFLPAKQPLEDIGIKQLRYIDPSLKLEEPVSGGGTVEVYNCSDLQKTIRSRANAVVAGNIFNSVAGNGCGKSVDVADNLPVAFWTGTAERILGPGDFGDFQLTSLAGAADAPAAIDVASDLSGEADAGEGTPGPIFMAVGFGPSCSLFNAQQLGGMTSVPVYRHVAPDQYNRFIGLFHVANAFPAAGGGVYANGTVEPVDQVAFVAVVDGAGDTKEEELGEWDGTRNTM